MPTKREELITLLLDRADGKRLVNVKFFPRLDGETPSEEELCAAAIAMFRPQRDGDIVGFPVIEA